MSTSEATSRTAVENPLAGASIVVLVTRTLAAAVIESDAPFGASLERKSVSRMETATGPETATAPPWPELTWISWLVHDAHPNGQHALLCAFHNHQQTFLSNCVVPVGPI